MVNTTLNPLLATNPNQNTPSTLALITNPNAPLITNPNTCWSQIEPKNIFFYIFAQKYIFFYFCQKCSYFHPNLLFLAGPPRRWCGWKRLQRRARKRWREAKLYHRGSLGGGVRGPVRVRGAELRRGQSQAAIKDLLRRKVRVSFQLPKRIKF